MDRSVKVGSIHCRDDLDLVMTGKDLGSPEPKRDLLEVPGMDGVIDQSTILTDGDVKFNNRKMTIYLVALNSQSEFAMLRQVMLNSIHGQRLKIVFDEDPTFYYFGECKVYFKEKPKVLEITIEVDADPYKYKTDETIYVDDVSGSKVVTYMNLRKWVVPVFKVSSEMQILFNDDSYVLSEGSYVLDDVVFKPGENIVKYIGTGRVTVVYQEGAL